MSVFGGWGEAPGDRPPEKFVKFFTRNSALPGDEKGPVDPSGG